MAAAAQKALENRTVEVHRGNLKDVLIANREKHIEDYEEAMQGYKSTLLKKIDEAFREAKAKATKRHEKAVSRTKDLTDEEISEQSDYLTLMDAVQVQMKVPRSYAKEYDAAIAIADWDVNETLELTHAEFTCFVRDEWDWKSSFEAVSMLYKMS